MKENRLRRVLSEGRVPVGHMIWEFGTRGIASILASTDLDFVLVDMEHTGFDTERIADLMAWFKVTDIAPLVRIPQRLYHFIARTMDAGALGVMVANVETAEEAREIVNAVKYAPLGGRGVGLGGAHTDYLTPDALSYFEYSNRNTTVICQIESVRGLANCESIAAVPGVDILWVGHYDLTHSMGITTQFQHPDFIAALSRVVSAAQSHGKAAGIQPGNLEQLREWRAVGYNVISWRNDITVYRLALADGVREVRRITSETSAQ